MQFAEDMKTPFLMRIGMELPAIRPIGFYDRADSGI